MSVATLSLIFQKHFTHGVSAHFTGLQSCWPEHGGFEVRNLNSECLRTDVSMPNPVQVTSYFDYTCPFTDRVSNLPFVTPHVMCPIAARARLKSLQPGHDGGRKKRRHKRGVYDVEGLRRAHPSVRNRVLQICMMLLADKEEGNSHSAADFERSMKTIWEILRSCSAVEEHLVADLLPPFFTSALSMLEDWGMTDGFLRQGVCRLRLETDECAQNFLKQIHRFGWSKSKNQQFEPPITARSSTLRLLHVCTFDDAVMLIFQKIVVTESQLFFKPVNFEQTETS